MSLHRSGVLLAALFSAASVGWSGGEAMSAAGPQQTVIQSPPPPGPPAGQRGQPLPVTGTGFVSGRVVDTAGDAVGGTVVMLSGSGPLRTVVTDSQGRFFFTALAPRPVRVMGSKPGYGPAPGPARPIELADGERVIDIAVRMMRLASLSGSVRDDAGDPVVGTDVWILRRILVSGQMTLRRFGPGRTDDRGTYRISNLQPGEYIACACGRDPMPFDGVLLTTLGAEPAQLLGVIGRALKVGADVAQLDRTLKTFAPTFHPSSATIARATKVALRPGDEKTGVDIAVTGVRAARVSGTILGATGAINAGSVRLVPMFESEEAVAFVQLAPMLVQPDGRFDFAGVPPGQYTLRVTHGRGGAATPTGSVMSLIGARGAPVAPAGQPAGPNQPSLWAAEPITVGEEGVTGLAIALRAGPTVSGRVEFVGAAEPPPANRRSPVLLGLLTRTDLSEGTAGIGTLNPDNTFQMAMGAPGKYAFQSLGQPGFPTLKSVTVAGRDVTDLALDIGGVDVAEVVITYSDAKPPSINGTLVGAARAAAQETTVLVFPADRRYWSESGAAARRFRVAAVSRTGAYTVTNLVAGEYFVIAVADDAAIDWQEPTRLEALSRTALRVQLADAETKTVDVKR